MSSPGGLPNTRQLVVRLQAESSIDFSLCPLELFYRGCRHEGLCYFRLAVAGPCS